MNWESREGGDIEHMAELKSSSVDVTFRTPSKVESLADAGHGVRMTAKECNGMRTGATYCSRNTQNEHSTPLRPRKRTGNQETDLLDRGNFAFLNIMQNMMGAGEMAVESSVDSHGPSQRSSGLATILAGDPSRSRTSIIRTIETRSLLGLRRH